MLSFQDIAGRLLRREHHANILKLGGPYERSGGPQIARTYRGRGMCREHRARRTLYNPKEANYAEWRLRVLRRRCHGVVRLCGWRLHRSRSGVAVCSTDRNGIEGHAEELRRASEG